MKTKCVEIKVRGEILTLLPDRAIWWNRKKSLMLSDLHLAKSGHFRKAGIALPSSIHENDLNRLSNIVTQFKVEKIYLLGDLFHSKENKEWKQFEKWRMENSRTEVLLVRGNHDKSEESKMRDHGIDEVYSAVNKDPFLFTHEKKVSAEGLYNISGHIHPGVNMSGKGRQSKTFSCFWFSNDFAVLPAFGNFTGNCVITPDRNDRIFIVYGDQLKEVTS